MTFEMDEGPHGLTSRIRSELDWSHDADDQIDALRRGINGRERKRNVIAALRTAACPFASTQASFTPFGNVKRRRQ